MTATSDKPSNPSHNSIEGNISRRRGVDRFVTTSDVSGTAAMTIYSTTWCGFCRRLKTQLDEAGIEYTEIDIESDPAAAEFVGSVNNGNHIVPTVLFADGTTATNPSLAAVKSALSS